MKEMDPRWVATKLDAAKASARLEDVYTLQRGSYLGAVTLFLVESLARRDANGRECIKPETARSVTGLLKREIKKTSQMRTR